MFETKANPGNSPPFASSKTKYFWLFRIEVTRTSLGSERYFSSNRPTMTTGYSTRFATVSTSGSSSTHFMPIRFSASRIPARILPFRSSRSTSTRASASRPGYSEVEESSMAPGGEEPVPEGRPPRRDVAERKRQDLVAVQRDDPVDRAGEPHVEVGPPHRLLERNRGEEVGDDLRKDLLDRAGRLLANEAEVVAAIGRKDGEGRDVDPLGPRESQGRLRRLAGGVQSHAFRRAHHGLFRRRLPVLEVPDHVRQPPRGTVDVDLPEGETGLLQHPLELLASEPERGADEPRRDFLAADLEQIVASHRNSSSRVVSSD